MLTILKYEQFTKDVHMYVWLYNVISMFQPSGAKTKKDWAEPWLFAEILFSPLFSIIFYAMQRLHNSVSSVHPTSSKETIANTWNILTSKTIHKWSISTRNIIFMHYPKNSKQTLCEENRKKLYALVAAKGNLNLECMSSSCEYYYHERMVYWIVANRGCVWFWTLGAA